MVQGRALAGIKMGGLIRRVFSARHFHFSSSFMMWGVRSGKPLMMKRGQLFILLSLWKIEILFLGWNRVRGLEGNVVFGGSAVAATVVGSFCFLSAVAAVAPIAGGSHHADGFNDDFHGVLIVALAVFPFAGFDAALDVDLVAFL